MFARLRGVQNSVKMASPAAMKPGLLTFLAIRSKSPPAESVEDWAVRAVVAVAGGGEDRQLVLQRL